MIFLLFIFTDNISPNILIKPYFCMFLCVCGFFFLLLLFEGCHVDFAQDPLHSYFNEQKSVNLHRTHCIHTSMNNRKMKFISYFYTCFYIIFIHCQNQNRLLVTRQNNNHSPVPWPGILVPSSHRRSELSNSILGTFSRGDKRVWNCIPVSKDQGGKLHL